MNHAHGSSSCDFLRFDADRFCPYPTGEPFYKHGLTLIPAWMIDYMLSKVWDEIA